MHPTVCPHSLPLLEGFECIPEEDPCAPRYGDPRLWYGFAQGQHALLGCAAGLCEFSNMFLANIELVKCCSTVHQNQIKQSVLYKLNSALLSLAYICCRLVLFPAVLAALLTDAYTHPELTVRSSMVEWVMMPMSICCVWAMSAFEFRNIFEGTFKVGATSGHRSLEN